MAALGAAALATLGARNEAAAIGWTRAAGRSGSAVRYPIPEADGVSIDRDAQVILVRWQDVVYAFALSCPHQNTALRWREADGRFQCPKHKSKYSPDGRFLSGRATRGMDRYAIGRDGGEVVVDLAVLHEQDKDEAAWAAAHVNLD